jgi:hypothetical protein
VREEKNDEIDFVCQANESAKTDDWSSRCGRVIRCEFSGAEHLSLDARVYYKNLWRYSKCFIGGSASAEENGVVDCVVGAPVRLLKSGAVVAETTTDTYGDFKFDRLEDNSGEYVVEVMAAGRAIKTVMAKLGVSINLGEIRL